MSELEWMAREERYRTRLTRMLVLMSLVAAVFFGSGFWILNQQQKRTEEAETAAAEAALLAEAAAARAAYAADSTAAAQRVNDFLAAHSVEELEGAPILVVKIPRGRGVASFLAEAWDDWARAAEPNADDARVRLLFKRHYVDVMNQTWYNSRGRLVWEGINPPSAILLPALRQRGKDLEFERTTFAQIVRGQETAGIRVIEEEELLEEGLGDEVSLTGAPGETPEQSPQDEAETSPDPEP